METTLSLCANCENAPGCTLRNGHPVLFCEEHQTERWKPIKNGISLNKRVINEPKVIEHFKGLCGNCELKDTCSWRNPGTVVFHCEHYL